MNVTITRWKSLVDPRGETTETTWSEVFAWLARRQVFRGDQKHPGWSPAEFMPVSRAQENVQRVFALCLDYDHGETIDGVRERLRGFYGLLHTTRKHTLEAPRFRVVLPLARPVSPFEFAALWVRFASFAGSIDEAPKDPSRFWYAPGCAPDSEFVAEELGGEAFLDPDEWLRKPDPTIVVAKDDYRPPRQRTDVEARAVAYLARMPASYEGQGGDKALWDAAIMLARGFALSERDTLRILASEFNPRCEPPWTEKRLAYKARQASLANLPSGFKLDTDREWAPQRSRVPREQEPQSEPDDWKTQAIEPEELGETVPRASAVERYKVVSLKQLFFDIHQRALTGKKTMGLTTGIPELDKYICGFRPEAVTIVGAPTSWGKSTMGSMVLDENDLRGEPILYIGNEDAQNMYGARVLARRWKMNAMRLRDNDLNKDDMAKIINAVGSASDRPVFMPAVGESVEHVCQAIRELTRELGTKLVIVDYIQRFKTDRRLQDRRNQVTYVAERLSDEIKRSGASGLMFSQLKRIEGRWPTVEDLKESGDLENMAEHVLLGHREKTGSDDRGREIFRRGIIVAKNKDGPIPGGDIEMPFDEVSASFTKPKIDHWVDDFAQPYTMPDFAQPYNERGER